MWKLACGPPNSAVIVMPEKVSGLDDRAVLWRVMFGVVGRRLGA
jgi:hypothetical protein